MTLKLKTVIKMLECVDQNKKLKVSLVGLHSFRGNPEELAVSISGEKIVSEILTEFKSAVNTNFSGWKGGEYFMTENTDIHFSNPGSIEEYEHWYSSFIDALFE